MLKFNVIMMPTDLSSHSLRALPYAIGLARQFDATLEVVSVIEPSLQVSDAAWVEVNASAMDDRAQTTVRQHMEERIINQLPGDIIARSSIVTGNPVNEIVRRAENIGADLIVMATHGRSGLGHMLMGSAAEAVVRKAPCPVLTLKSPAVVIAGDEDLTEMDNDATDAP
jgi:nucleotide-binding universal stress UspA family protein